MLLVFLLASAVSFVGCGRGVEKYVLMKRYDTHLSCPIELQISSNSDVFSKDDITLNISYSMKTREYTGEEIKSYYYDLCLNNYDIVYGVYIVDIYDYKAADADHRWNVNDINNLENHYFVKQITEQEALTEEFVSKSPWFAYGYGFYRYNHTESITVPQQFASGEQGTFVIAIIMFGILEDQSCVALDSARIECDYKEMDENTIRINMKDWKYFRIL